MAFPIGPYTDGQTHTEAGTTYNYRAAIGGWDKAVAAGGIPSTRRIDTTGSLTGGGALSADLNLSLVNDVENPGANRWYGTSATAVKGWRPATPPTLLYAHAQLLGNTYASGEFLSFPNAKTEGGITLTELGGTDGTLISLGGNRTFMIDVVVTRASPVPFLQIFSRTTGGGLWLFYGATSFIVRSSITTNISIRYVDAAPITLSAGALSVTEL